MADQTPERPRTRAECPPMQADGSRPCPWASCRHHLALHIDRRGAIVMTDKNKAVWEWKRPCALDHVDEEGMTLDEVADVMGMSYERVRQLEERALIKIRMTAPWLARVGAS